MEFNQLEYFKAVAAAGSVSRAAESLHITQPALSRSIAKLEQEVGAPLFDRKSHGIRLNTYGKIFLGSAELAMSQLNSGIESIRRLYRQDNNVLALTCSSEDFLADMLIGFTAVYPEIAVRQYGHPAEDIEKHLLNHSVELALSMQPINSEYLQVEVLSSAECVLVCQKSRGLPDKVSLRELSDIGFICDESRLSGRQLTALCARYGAAPRITHQVEHSLLLNKLLRADAGAAIIPLPSVYQLQSRYGASDLTIHRIAEPIPRSEIQAAWLRDRPLSPGAIKFIVYVREKMAEEQMDIEKWMASQTV